MLSLVTISHYGYVQGFPINAAEVSKCHFTKVRGTSHFFPLQFTVGSNTTQEPSQDFEIKLEDAVNCVCRNGKRGGLTQTMWVTVGLRFSPCYWWKEIMTAPSCAGQRSETEPTPGFFNPLSLDLVPLSIPKQIQLDPSIWVILPSSVSSFCRNLVLCLKLSLHLEKFFLIAIPSCYMASLSVHSHFH